MIGICRGSETLVKSSLELKTNSIYNVVLNCFIFIFLFRLVK